LLSNPKITKSYDLSSVRTLFTGAAPLGDETQQEISKMFPKWKVGQGYGMTETSTLVLSSGELDIVSGTAGSLLPRVRAKIIGPDGTPITEYGQRGELWIQSPSLALGYLNNERATTEIFVFDADGRWIRTGDVAIASRSPAGHVHFSIVDRVKELIKVKVCPSFCRSRCPLLTRVQGHQVPPAELEAHLLSHPAVDDVAVIPIPHESSGEVPKAYVVKAPSFASRPEDEVIREICKHVEDHKARYKWLKGGVTFIDTIPKTPSGKILRRHLRDREKEARRNAGAKI
jgi:acyl-CoA synthetase (AMP-forming)/AMP-acid ligase II